MSNLHRRARDQGAVRIIVQLRIETEGCDETPASEPCRFAIAETRAALLDELGGTSYRVTRGYGTIPFAALEVSPEALQVLEGSSRVEGISEDTLSAPQGSPN